MHRIFYKAASLFAALAVIIGAFGAHFLKDILLPQELESVQTGVTYQMTHAIALFITGFIYRAYHNVRTKVAGYLFFVGIVLFSGSIYLRILLKHLDFPKSNMVTFITPIGGALFIIGWLILMFAIPSSGRKYHQSNE